MLPVLCGIILHFISRPVFGCLLNWRLFVHTGIIGCRRCGSRRPAFTTLWFVAAFKAIIVTWFHKNAFIFCYEDYAIVTIKKVTDPASITFFSVAKTAIRILLCWSR